MAGLGSIMQVAGKAGGSDKAGAGLSLATGLLQSLQASKLKKQAEGAMPGLVDPNQASFLSELNQKRRSIETGADFAAGMDAIDSTQSTVNNAIAQNAGGDTGGAMQALLSAQRAAGEGKNRVLSSGQSQQMAYDSQYNRLLGDMSARTLELQLLDHQEKMAQWAKKRQFASQNLNAGLAGFLGSKKTPVGGGVPAGATPPISSTPIGGSFDEKGLIDSELGPNFDPNGI